MPKGLHLSKKLPTFALELSHKPIQGEMVEWSITAVLKTAVPRGTGGSNPSLSANRLQKDFTKVVILAFEI